MPSSPPEDDLRPLLFSIAYRMLGSVGDAEDVVQDAFLRLERARAEGTVVQSPRAFLTTLATRLAIDQLRSARVQRETYFGPWLPEPLVMDTTNDPSEMAEMADTLSLSFLVLLETLGPVERAVFLLRRAFDYDYNEIADVVGRSEANCRQIFARAEKRIDEGRTRFRVDRAQQQELSGRFIAAAREGDRDGLVGLLAEDVAFYGDGGGKGRGLPAPLFGKDKVGRFLGSLIERFLEAGVRMDTRMVNGHPALLNFDVRDRLINVMSFDFADGQVQTVRSIINPDKLAHLGLPLSPLARRAPEDWKT